MLESKEGMLVVQTFLSTQKSEELQIQGRTARQGKKGSYCMILLESDLKTKFKIDSAMCEARPREDLYNFLDETRKSLQDKLLEKDKK